MLTWLAMQKQGTVLQNGLPSDLLCIWKEVKPVARNILTVCLYRIGKIKPSLTNEVVDMLKHCSLLYANLDGCKRSVPVGGSVSQSTGPSNLQADLAMQCTDCEQC